MRPALAIPLVLLSLPAWADDGTAPRRSLLSPAPPVVQPEDEPAYNPDLARPTAFGVRGSRRFTAGLRGAQDFQENQDISLFAQQTWFVVDDVEIGVEGAAWWIFQDDDTWGVSSSLVVRHHIYQSRVLSFYIEGGIGLFIAADNVPDEGTSFGLMPRAGVGTSLLIDDRDTRLLLGLHWHHISNARINGEARNPARDGVALYVAVSVPI